VTEPLLTISAFAKAVDLPAGTLRYYDEAGLLPPAEVDPQTGYRYYTPALERRAHMIRRMREVGVPVETMRLVLESSPDQAAEVLRAFASRSAEEARRTSDAVADVVGSLRSENVPARPVTVTVDGPELAAALTRVSFAASTEAGSPLAHVLLDIGAAELTVVATDRYWMALWRLPLQAPDPGERRAVLPVREVGRLQQWLRREELVRLTVTEQQTSVTGEQGELKLCPAEDRLPAYQLVLDSVPRATGRVAVERAELVRALAAETGTVRLVVAEDRLTVAPVEAAEGARLAAITSGEPVTLGFSATLLRGALEAMVGSQVTLHYAAANRPVRVCLPEQRNLTALVMPCRLEP
jgi:DNA-binding transcriptional MerR regulator